MSTWNPSIENGCVAGVQEMNVRLAVQISADMSSQAGLGTTYLVIQQMRIVPIDKQGVMAVAIEAAAPLLVVVVTKKVRLSSRAT